MRREIIIVALFVFSVFLIPLAEADIVISEVMWSHDSSSNCEYIELYNNGADSVDLSSWQTQQATGATWRGFSDLTISSGEYIIVANRLTGSPSFETCYGNGDGTWNSSDGSYQAVDGNIAFSSSDNIASIRDGSQTVRDTFNYGTSYGADGDGNSLHLLGNGSIAFGTETLGADSGISYCGDGTCNSGETCSSCSVDCLAVGQVCCSGTAYTGDCCETASCDTYYECINHECTEISYCGDGTCDANESCSNCTSDCLLSGRICCSGTSYVGNCCNNSNCSINHVCTSHICVAAGYCGDGTCDANESCSNCSADCSLSTGQCCSVASSNSDSHGRVNSTSVTTSGKICCSGTDYTGTCCSDAECASPNVCASNHICVTPYTNECTSVSCTCDLFLNIQANSIFQMTSTNFYINLKDLKNNYTGSVTVTHWIENSSGYVASHSPANITMSINENKTMAYSPVQRCGNSTEYLKVKIANFGCNDTSSLNNQANSTIIINGISCLTSSSSAETSDTSENAGEETEEATEEVVYTINVPSQLKITKEEESSGSIQKKISVSVNLENKESKTKEFEVWSYVYSGDSCYSCIDGKKDANKVVVSLDSGLSDTLDLENSITLLAPGTYIVKVQVLDRDTSEIKEFDYEVQVASSFESETELSTEENLSYLEKSSAKKAKFYSFLLFSLLMAGTAGFFGYKNRERIMEFVDEKKKAFQKKKNWKDYLEQRRGKGIFERLSGGFMKSKEK